MVSFEDFEIDLNLSGEEQKGFAGRLVEALDLAFHGCAAGDGALKDFVEDFTTGQIWEELGPAGVIRELLPDFGVGNRKIHLCGDGSTPGGVGAGVEENFASEQGTEIVAGWRLKCSLGNNHGTSPKML